MILAPASAGREKVDCGIGFSAGFLGLFEEFEMLEDLRGDDSKERFIARHHRWFAVGEDMADHDGKESVFGKKFDNMAVIAFF